MTRPEPTPATPDELAVVYLKARDVPCPACGYNRRDGTSAACPECTTRIQIINQPRYLQTPHRVWAAAVATTLIASSSAVSGYFIYTAFANPYGSQVMRRITFAVFLVSIGCNLLALRAVFALRREYPGKPGLPLFRLLIAIGVAGILQTLMFNLFIYLPYM